MGRYGESLRLAERLMTDYAHFSKIPAIELEYRCMKYLADQHVDGEMKKGGFEAPARVISALAKSKADVSSEPFIRSIEQLCAKYRNSEWSALLSYHYAWMLDAVGRDQEAAAVFNSLCSVPAVRDAAASSQSTSITGTLREYAKIQQAVILSERGDYPQALRVLAMVEKTQADAHTVTLAQSLGKSIDILKREVPANDVH